MHRKILLLGFILSLLSLVLACNPFMPLTTPPTSTPRATDTPRPTETPPPPKPLVDYTPVPPETLSPIIVQRSPQRGEALQPDGAIELIFDKAMNRESVRKALRVQKAGETPEPVQGELTWVDERTVRFRPQKALARAATYDVILTQNASAESGEPLREPYVFRFATAGYLEVAQVVPAPNTADVETDASITVIFNRPVVPLTSLEQMEALPDPLTFEPAIAGEGEWLNTSIYVFTPEEPLPGGVEVTAKVAAGLKDVSGAVLAEDYVWRFTTLPPKVVWTHPQDGADLVDIETPIRVEFNQPVDLDSARAAFHLKKSTLLGGQDISGDYGIRNNTLIFTPTQALDFDTVYVATVDAGVTSRAGGVGMREAFSWRFTTVPLPRIVRTIPADGDRDAPSRTGFQIEFNTRIDPTTVMPNLTMTPPLSPTQVYTYFSVYNNTFVLNFGAQPSTEYTVVIDDGIADPYGNTIPRGAAVNFRTGPLPPTYRLHTPSDIATYDAALPAQLVVGHLNVTRLELELYQLPLSVLKSENQLWQEDLPSGADLLRAWQRNLESPLNKQAYTVLDLVEGGGTLDPGVYLLRAESPDIDDDYGARQRHVLVVSDLNLTLKTAPDEALIWATDLATGEPVADLDLTLFSPYDTLDEQVVTDGDGVAQVDLPRNRGQVWAISETPFAAIAEGWGRGISPWDFGVSEGLYMQDYRMYITTDRPIYRPGQTVNFKGVLRAEDDAIYRLPGVSEVRVMIRSAEGAEIYQERLPLSEQGTFHGTVDLEEGAALGDYAIVVEFKDFYAQKVFQVAAYRPPEFEVTVETGATEVQRGDDVAVTINASYYFGGPLADALVEWNVLAERTTFEPPWGGRYSFDDVDDPYICYRCWWWEPPAPREPIMSGRGRTDAQGRLQITLDGDALDEALQKGAHRLIIEAVATGPDNQPIAGRTTAVVHPGPYYIGLQAQEYVGDAGEESNIDLVAVDWEGERLSDKQIRVEVYRREWKNTFVRNEFGGGYWDWETEDVFVTELEVTTDELGEAVATFVPPQGGSYHVIATPADPTPETERIRSSIFLWVAGEESVSWRRENHDRITLVSDKTTYDVGETAEILIPSPFTGPHQALVTVERGSVRRHEVIRLETNSAIYRLPIEAGDIPNIYVSVVLIQGRDDGPADFKMGLLPLDVNAAPKRLSLEVEPDTEQAQPGEEVTYTVTATEPDGGPAVGAELSFDLVDKAVLSLRPRGADIHETLYARRALNVQTASALSISANRYMEELAEDLDLVEQSLAQDEAERAFGIGGGEMEEEVAMEMPAPMATMPVEASKRSSDAAPPEGVEIREEFADTAAWKPVLVTDGDGQAQVTVTLPDNLTTWTARVVGLTAETEVGEETSDLVATKPLLVRPVAPRFFVVDDRAQLAANVSNNTDEALEVSVRLSVEGASLSEETPGEQMVTIPARSEAKVTWWVTVGDVEQAQLIFSAVSGEYADASKPRLATGPEGSLQVLRYTAPDIVGTAGQLVEGGGVAEAIALPPDVDTRRGQLTVQLDPSLAAGMRDGLDYLEHFEYECTEQTVSRFLPNLLTYRALQSLNIDNPELAAKLPGLVEEGLQKLYQQQNPDGGWGWWYRTDDWHSNPYLSGYVVFALVKAWQMDVAVDEDVLAKGIAYLQSQIQEVDTYENTRNANHQAWLLYVLAEAGEEPARIVDNLYEHRDKLSHYARAYLAQAIWLQGGRDRSDDRLETLLSDLNNAAILSATGAHWEENYHDWWAMNTDTRSTAIVLDTLTKLDPDNALNPNVVRWLMVARDAGVWETTQETAWALIALTDWMVETGELDADYDFALYLNDDLLTEGSATRETVQEGVTVEVAVADLLVDATNALAVARTEGPGRLYYTAHLEVYRPVEALEPADRGFIIRRRYTDAACAAEALANGGRVTDCPELREVKLGDVVRVDLTIITPHDRYYVVVEDPLPAGGEAIDTGLATTSLLAMDPTLRRQDSRYWWWWRWYSRSELRDEKVVLFADVLGSGTYEYSYTFRATLPGDYHVLPTVAKEFYFPEVFGRSGGRLLTIGQ
ncbi:MAG: Ig-like domain-containing protein [Anaerolineae bacterium]